ncbi:C6 finger domain protein [Aspergillus niger]|nr:C6 finger domain protein [Aspergillus niger]
MTRGLRSEKAIGSLSNEWFPHLSLYMIFEISFSADHRLRYMTRLKMAKSQSRPPRRKACSNCIKSKVRCTLDRPACSRCRLTGRTCDYGTTTTALEHRHFPRLQETHIGETDSLESQSVPSPSVPELSSRVLQTPPSLSYTPSPSANNTIWCPPNQQAQELPIEAFSKEKEFDFEAINLTPSSIAEDIRDRWLRPFFLPAHGRSETPKVCHPHTLQFIARIMKTYPRYMLRDRRPPPIIHHVQVRENETPRALANCYSLVRMWEQAVPGSEEIVLNTVAREMERLASEVCISIHCTSYKPQVITHLKSPDQHDYELLSSFQAYLIYSILMYFGPRGGFSDTIIITLMNMASQTARNGLFCAAELARTRPTWESWIVAATKRRAIFTLYIFSNIYNADRMLPNFVAEELRGVYAPGNKALWEAADRETWNKEYDRYLLDWQDGSLEISELWPSTEMEEPERRRRIERWVQTVDEFGMMLYSVCAHIHGS